VYFVGALAPLCSPGSGSYRVFLGRRRGADPGWAPGEQLVSVSSVGFRWRILKLVILVPVCFARIWQLRLPGLEWFGSLWVIVRFVQQVSCSFLRYV
jgi:hypothetical protein